jgi:tetratricopeptide (TPR) repeat protein
MRYAKLACLVTSLALLGAGHNVFTEESGPLELTSLLGRKLYALPDDAAVTAAKKKLAADPKNVSLILALSKAQAARRQYKEAVATCTAGLAFEPDNADLLLERGHRELGLREFEKARADLARAVEINPKNLDEYYHLGLAHYFLLEFDQAADSFRKALNLAQNNDSVIDCSNWLYVSLRRANKPDEAAQVLARITPDVQNKEPHLLFYLKLLHFYQGKASANEILPPRPTDPNDVESELAFDTISYGLGNWRVYNDHNPTRARQLFLPVVSGNAWNSWGFIGSELELGRTPIRAVSAPDR